jgi:pullulanase
MYGSQTIYLKGSFNGWGNVDELVYQGDSTYQVDMVLTAGNYEFKFANADWSDINYGALADDPVINLGEPKLLYYNAANIQLTIPADGTYRFTVTGPNESAPKMTVTPL